MAILKRNILQDLNGKLGTYVIKSYNGKTVLSARPGSYKMSHSAAAVKVRKTFKAASVFSKNVKSLKVLESIWSSFNNINNNPYIIIFKYNFHKTGTDMPTLENIITPGGYKLPVISAGADADRAAVTISPLNEVYPVSAAEVILSLSMLVCFIEPINPKDEPFEIIALSKDFANIDFTKDIQLGIEFNAVQKSKGLKYSKNILYISAATKSADGDIIMYSSTFSKMN